jgi:hypothetical protein
MTVNRSSKDYNSSHYSPDLITILLPSSFLCLACLASLIVYIYLRKYRQKFNKNEQYEHNHILKRYVYQFNEKQQENKDKTITPSYLCRLHQNKFPSTMTNIHPITHQQKELNSSSFDESTSISSDE